MGCYEGSQTHGQPSRQFERDRMVDQQIVARGVKDPVVLACYAFRASTPFFVGR